jgi:hypothetical protein
MTLPEVLAEILFVLGVGFFVANVLKGYEVLQYWRRRSRALLVWRGQKPRYYRMMLGIGCLLVLVALYKGLVREFALWQLFGEVMMILYYLYMVPMAARIARGLYADGIWTDTGFMSYQQIGGISWRETDPPMLVVISRLKMQAHRLVVPGLFLGEVRRLLRDKISSHAIEMDSGPGLHLGERDARDSV